MPTSQVQALTKEFLPDAVHIKALSTEGCLNQKMCHCFFPAHPENTSDSLTEWNTSPLDIGCSQLQWKSSRSLHFEHFVLQITLQRESARPLTTDRASGWSFWWNLWEPRCSTACEAGLRFPQQLRGKLRSDTFEPKKLKHSVVNVPSWSQLDSWLVCQSHNVVYTVFVLYKQH